MARTASMGFGNAIHYALEFYFRKIDLSNVKTGLPSLSDLISLFKKGMDIYHSHFTKIEFENHLAHGEKVLTAYFETYSQHWLEAKEYKLEHVADDISYHGIPVKGKLDKIVLYDNKVDVVDYKTGKYRSDKLKPPLGPEDNGGDYWRQLVFYKILIDHDAKNQWQFGNGIMDFVEQDKDGKFHTISHQISKLDEDLVKDQILDSYAKIKNHEFDGCNEENCKWCDFVNEINDLNSPLVGDEVDTYEYM